jgi:outer membrane protein assembly factor BamB
MCLDRETGDTIWQKTACEAVPHERHHRTASFASASPVTDGKNLYISFGSRGVYSYDMDGNFRWKKDLGPMRTRHSFGEGSSPALYGDTLVVLCDQEDQSFITALDANSGKTKWRVDRDEETTWTTPLIVEHGGRTQVIVNGTNRSRSYDLANGELIWQCGGQAQGVVPTPIVYGDLVFCMTGHRGAALNAIPLDSTGDITDTDKIAWSRDNGTPYVPSPLLYDDLLYFTKSNNAILTCVSAETGAVHFENKRLEGLDTLYASAVGASDRIYISGRDGTTLVLKKGTELEVLASNHVGETIDATPAIAGKQMFIRGEKHLFCIAE